MTKTKCFEPAHVKYNRLEYEWYDHSMTKISNPYVNDSRGLYNHVWNYDNVILFELRYSKGQGPQKKRYRNRSLLFNYCARLMPTHTKACRLLIALGSVGILDIVDLLEAEDWIREIDPKKARNVWKPYIYPPYYKEVFIELVELVKEGLSV